MYAYVIIRRCGPPVYPIDRLTSTHTQKCGARSAAPVSDQGSGGSGLAKNTYRQQEIFPLEFPSVKVSVGIRKPCGLPPIQSIRSYSFRIAVPGRTGPRYAFRGGSAKRSSLLYGQCPLVKSEARSRRACASRVSLSFLTETLAPSQQSHRAKHFRRHSANNFGRHSAKHLCPSRCRPKQMQKGPRVAVQLRPSRVLSRFRRRLVR